jgi:hypothetical protein
MTVFLAELQIREQAELPQCFDFVEINASLIELISPFVEQKDNG